MYTVYSKSGCPYCTKLITILRYQKYKHVIYELGRDFNREEFYSKFGEGSTFPQVLLDDRHLGGCKETINFIRENFDQS